MNPPLIGVSTSVTVDRYPERAYVNAASLGAVQQAGGIPVLLPPQLEPSTRAELLKRLHGVLLTGGGDVDPARFGEAPHSTTADVSAARDGLEIELTRRAIETRTPLLAICRGLKDVAWAPESIIEGVELVDDSRFVVGVQWHPEELVGHDPTARNLFRALVERARERPATG